MSEPIEAELYICPHHGVYVQFPELNKVNQLNITFGKEKRTFDLSKHPRGNPDQCPECGTQSFRYIPRGRDIIIKGEIKGAIATRAISSL